MTWKDEIDRKRQEEQARYAQQQREREQREAVTKAAREQAEQERNLRRLQQRFKCYICRTPATIPLHVVQTSRPDEGQGWSAEGDNWDWPGDLYQCAECNKWTCSTHHYQGLCQKCGEKELRRRR